MRSITQETVGLSDAVMKKLIQAQKLADGLLGKGPLGYDILTETNNNALAKEIFFTHHV